MNLTTGFRSTFILGSIFCTLFLLATVDMSTMAQSGCYPHGTAYVTGGMNIRESATTDSPVVATARAGESFSVSQSQQGDSWCWLNIGKGWMAKTSRVSSTRPAATARTQPAATQQAVEQQAVEQQDDVDNCCFTGWQCSADDEWTSGY